MPDLALQAQRIADSFTPSYTGSPSRITEADTVQTLLEAVDAGNYMETACQLAGISKVTVYDWLKKAEAGEETHQLFANALKRAQARAEAREVANVTRAGAAGPQYWAASMTYLERRYPERWGKRQDEQSGPKVIVQIGLQDSDVKVNVVTLSPPTVNELPE